jgi:hypothetical protein
MKREGNANKVERKPEYEAPVVVDLGELPRGHGAPCTNGTGAGTCNNGGSVTGCSGGASV